MLAFRARWTGQSAELALFFILLSLCAMPRCKHVESQGKYRRMLWLEAGLWQQQGRQQLRAVQGARPRGDSRARRHVGCAPSHIAPTPSQPPIVFCRAIGALSLPSSLPQAATRAAPARHPPRRKSVTPAAAMCRPASTLLLLLATVALASAASRYQDDPKLRLTRVGGTAKVGRAGRGRSAGGV